MTNHSSKVTIHMVSSLDGYIAKKDGSVEWMHSTDHYQKGITLSEEEVAAYLQSIDCYVMGSRTYEHALELGWPYGEVPVVVMTHRELSTDKANVEFCSEDLRQLVNNRLKPRYRNIWMVGGAVLAKQFIRMNLADDLIISIMPILLGDGKLFFESIGQERPLHLRDVTAYKDGMVELWYEINNTSP